jgi:RNA polymerase sigma-70 factor (ECF subfamily)
MNPEHLLHLTRLGDQRAATSFFKHIKERAHRIMRRALGPDEAHDDLVQDVILALLEGLHSLRDPSALEGWVATITLNKIRSELRRRRVRRVPLVALDTPEAVLPPYDDRERLHRVGLALAQLPADERLAFSLRFIEDLSLVEVASKCDCSLATAKRRIQAAQSRFRRIAARDPLLVSRVTPS